jgi:hypothetical protein
VDAIFSDEAVADGVDSGASTLASPGKKVMLSVFAIGVSAASACALLLA